MNTYDFPFDALSINEEDIFVEIGHSASYPAFNGYLKERINYLLSDISSRSIGAEGVYRIIEGKVEKTLLKLGKENLQIGPQIAAIMNKGKYFAIFAVSAGEEFESYLRSSSEASDVLDNYILHAIGNWMVEKAEHLLEIKLEEEMKGMPHTQRFSPGYCQWPLADQGKIVTLLDHPCGIRLTDYYFMIPAKSVTGIIGFGEGVKTDVSECELCELGTVCYKSKFTTHSTKHITQNSKIIHNK
jgi:hypothetical protein